MLSGRGLCDELITRPEESYRLCCVVVCDLETSRMGAPYIYDISHLRVNELETNSKNKNIRDFYISISEFMNGYQPRNNTVKKEKSDLIVDACKILDMRRNIFSQPLNVRWVSDGRKTE